MRISDWSSDVCSSDLALFLLALFFSPLATSIPGYATAPALVFVACLMARGLSEIDWEDMTEYAPGLVTALAMPLTYSIAHGIAFGFIPYAAIKLLQIGRASCRERVGPYG